MVITTLFTILFSVVFFVATGGEFFIFALPMALATLLLLSAIPSSIILFIDRFLIRKFNITVRSSKNLLVTNMFALGLSSYLTGSVFGFLHWQHPNPGDLAITIYTNILIILFFILYGLIKYDMLKTLENKLEAQLWKKIIFKQMLAGWLLVTLLFFSSIYIIIPMLQTGN